MKFILLLMLSASTALAGNPATIMDDPTTRHISIPFPFWPYQLSDPGFVSAVRAAQTNDGTGLGGGGNFSTNAGTALGTFYGPVDIGGQLVVSGINTSIVAQANIVSLNGSLKARTLEIFNGGTVGGNLDVFATLTAGTITDLALTAGRMVLADSGPSLASATASGAVPIDADGTATTFSQIDALSGNLAVSHLNGGSGASSSTFWRGDGTWASSGSSGDAAADGVTKGIATFTAADFNSSAGLISIDYANGQAASGSLKGFLTSSDWTTFNNKVATTRTISTTSPLTGGGDLSSDRTFAINNAAADGSTKGAAAFTASDFDASSGVISIDYANGQAASGSLKGFLTSADWTTFNGKQDAGSYITALTGIITASGPGSAVSSFGSFSSATLATALTDESGVLGVFPRFSLTSIAAGQTIGWNGSSWTNGPFPTGTAPNFLTNASSAYGAFYANVGVDGILYMTNGTRLQFGGSGSSEALKDAPATSIWFYKSAALSTIGPFLSGTPGSAGVGSGVIITGTNGPGNQVVIASFNSGLAGNSNLVITSFTNAYSLGQTNIVMIHGTNASGREVAVFDGSASLHLGGSTPTPAVGNGGNLQMDGGFSCATNQTITAHFGRGWSMTNMGGATTLANPIGVDGSKLTFQPTLFTITNNTAATILVTAAPNMKTFWFGTNVTGFYVTNCVTTWWTCRPGKTNCWVGPEEGT